MARVTVVQGRLWGRGLYRAWASAKCTGGWLRCAVHVRGMHDQILVELRLAGNMQLLESAKRNLACFDGFWSTDDCAVCARVAKLLREAVDGV